jgi:hypothetical protein
MMDMRSIEFSQLNGLPMLTLVVALLWSLFWKGLALWHAARKNRGWWFVIMLFVNTLGILEIIYLFGVEKVKSDKLFK